MTEGNVQQIDATAEHIQPDPLAVAYRKALEALQSAWSRRQPTVACSLATTIWLLRPRWACSRPC